MKGRVAVTTKLILTCRGSGLWTVTVGSDDPLDLVWPGPEPGVIARFVTDHTGFWSSRSGNDMKSVKTILLKRLEAKQKSFYFM